MLFSTGAGLDAKRDAEEIGRVTSKHFGVYTLFRGQGFWRDRQELSYQLLVVTGDGETLDDLAADLKEAFGQESVMEIRHEASSVIIH